MPDEARKFLEAHDDWMEKELTGSLPMSYVKYRIAEPAAEHIRRLLDENAEIRELVNNQAEDEGLWFVAMTAPEEYLQTALRLLHARVEALGA